MLAGSLPRSGRPRDIEMRPFCILDVAREKEGSSDGPAVTPTRDVLQVAMSDSMTSCTP